MHIKILYLNIFNYVVSNMYALYFETRDMLKHTMVARAAHLHKINNGW